MSKSHATGTLIMTLEERPHRRAARQPGRAVSLL
jgi:hypothetical protein